MDVSFRIPALLRSGTNYFQWPDHLLGPRPRLKSVSAVCWIFFAIYSIGLVVLFWGKVKTGSGFFHDFASDFIYQYGMGHIWNEQPHRLYDYNLQVQVFQNIHQPPHGLRYGPSPYPPFVAMFFSLFARLPYKFAYLTWLCISVALYAAGVLWALKAAFPHQRPMRSLFLCFALAYFPFFMNTLANGQLGTVAVFAIGLALYLESRTRYFASGLVLSLLTYKPTLLLLVLPMLVLSRKFKTLSGFVTGALSLTLIATLYAGPSIWLSYAHILGSFSRIVGLQGPTQLVLPVYIDFSSFSHTVPGGRSVLGSTLFILLTTTIVTALAVLLWRSAKADIPAQHLAWAATLTWTLLLNVYVPIYDSILAVVAIALALGALVRLKWSNSLGWTTILSLLVYLGAWNAVERASDVGLQMMTILLFMLGSMELYLLNAALRQEMPCRREPTLWKAEGDQFTPIELTEIAP